MRMIPLLGVVPGTPGGADGQDAPAILVGGSTKTATSGGYTTNPKSRTASPLLPSFSGDHTTAAATAGGALLHPHSDSAFFTLLAGFKPHTSEPIRNKNSYLGYLLHLAAVRFVLDSVGAKSDFVILFRLMPDESQNPQATTMPEPQAEFFSKLRMRIEYLPQERDPEMESFKIIMMQKFQLLRFHDQYKHVLFLDADTLPLCNLDHYFNMSDRGIFAPNLVFAYKNEPAGGGFFLISPETGDWERYSSSHTFINSTHGFGSPLTEPAEGLRMNYTSWNWYGSPEDQGFLYHWVRYVKKNVTLVRNGRVQKWVGSSAAAADGGGQVEVVKMVEEIHKFNITCPNPVNMVRPPPLFTRDPVYRDFHHYSGRGKPWQKWNWSQPILDVNRTSNERYVVWAVALRDAWREYQLGSIQGLFPNMPKNDSLRDDIAEIQAFLQS